MTRPRPLILVSNDDGYRAEGIHALIRALEPLGEVWMVAPDRERSAIGHAISLHQPLRISEIGPRRFWCDGTPTDAAYIGINELVPRKPDLVVSGVNHGPNLGDDVTYSGTVAVALEGAVHGIPSLAVSALGPTDGGFDVAAGVASHVAAQMLRHGLPPRTLLSLNVPKDYQGLGVEVARLGRRNYRRLVEERVDPRGGRYYWIGGPPELTEDEPGTDCHAVKRGRASLTPLSLDIADHAALEVVRQWSLSR